MSSDLVLRNFDRAIQELRSSISSFVARPNEAGRAADDNIEGDKNVVQAAAYLGLSVRTVRNLEYRRELIPMRHGRRVTYSKRQLDDYRTWRETMANARLRRP